MLLSSTAFAATLSGSPVFVQKGVPSFTCTLTVVVDPPHPGGAATISLSGNAACNGVVFSGGSKATGPSSLPLTHDYTGPGSDFTVYNVYATTVISPGDCAGNFTATWNGSGWDVVGILPEVTPGSGDCLVAGVVS